MKWILLAGLTLSFFVCSHPAFAKSGCCSGHNGVSCAAGAQGSGKVICNDGWKGSSCLYSEMTMCGGSDKKITNTTSTKTTPPTTKPVPTITTIKPSPKPSLVPSPSPSIVPTPTPTPTNEPSPVPSPEVLGTEDKSQNEVENENEDSGQSNPMETITGLALLGGASYGGYKLFKGRKSVVE